MVKALIRLDFPTLDLPNFYCTKSKRGYLCIPTMRNYIHNHVFIKEREKQTSFLGPKVSLSCSRVLVLSRNSLMFFKSQIPSTDNGSCIIRDCVGYFRCYVGIGKRDTQPPSRKGNLSFSRKL